jgi:hypothetical protein
MGGIEVRPLAEGPRQNTLVRVARRAGGTP